MTWNIFPGLYDTDKICTVGCFCSNGDKFGQIIQMTVGRKFVYGWLRYVALMESAFVHIYIYLARFEAENINSVPCHFSSIQ
jgi:hypothetical protein